MLPTDLATSWSQTAYGPARWARAIPVLVDYLRPRYPTLTFLGALGDQTHIGEGNTSAHNPVTKGPDGLGLVLAIDLGVQDGNLAPLFEIRSLIYSHPGDPRMAGEGYMSGPDDQANNWPLGSGWNGGNSDIGHLHINVAAKFFPFQPGGYLPSMDYTTPWDFMAAPLPEVDLTPEQAQQLADIDTKITALEAGMQQTVLYLVKPSGGPAGEPEAIWVRYPDGSYLHVPGDNTTVDNVAALKAAGAIGWYNISWQLHVELCGIAPNKPNPSVV